MKYVAFIAGLALVSAGCGGGDYSSSASSPAASAAVSAASCPKAWKAGWQKLANDVGSTVYCPRWMPEPVDGRIGGTYRNGRSVLKDHSYLVSFLWFDHDSGMAQEVHVNFRGYPGRTSVPTCESTATTNGKTVRTAIPCFSDPQKAKRPLGRITATVYTVNQGVDAWHVLYAWTKDGALYTVSEHVTTPYTYAEVLHNLDRMVRGLVALEPTV